MKQTPLLIKPFLFDQIVFDLKTVTRRASGLDKINLHPDQWYHHGIHRHPKSGHIRFDFINDHTGEIIDLKCPYAHDMQGDHIWFKEITWKALNCNSGEERTYFRDGTHYHEWESGKYDSLLNDQNYDGRSLDKKKWKVMSPMFHKKKHARLWAEITDIRVERLQDITEDDAISEGIQMWYDLKDFKYYLHYTDDFEGLTIDPIESFKSLICHINGAEMWNANQWVWVIRFKRHNPTNDYLFSTNNYRKYLLETCGKELDIRIKN